MKAFTVISSLAVVLCVSSNALAQDSLSAGSILEKKSELVQRLLSDESLQEQLRPYGTAYSGLMKDEKCGFQFEVVKDPFPRDRQFLSQIESTVSFMVGVGRNKVDRVVTIKVSKESDITAKIIQYKGETMEHIRVQNPTNNQSFSLIHDGKGKVHKVGLDSMIDMDSAYARELACGTL